MRDRTGTFLQHKPVEREKPPVPDAATPYHCYVLRCADGTLYTGVTTDVARRIGEHNAGKGARYTASRRPVRLVWQEPQADRSSAQRREAAIKSWPRSRKETLIG